MFFLVPKIVEAWKVEHYDTACRRDKEGYFSIESSQLNLQANKEIYRLRREIRFLFACRPFFSCCVSYIFQGLLLHWASHFHHGYQNKGHLQGVQVHLPNIWQVSSPPLYFYDRQIYLAIAFLY
ncbi:hypothetical protein Tsubulata_021339 [Turnera subulata]|uniref:Uncharacterized protein n=1 Tax=Turnera subulata TaxID=218843 RepID=A0A9Q0G257_9ROSI|nr:hypothetical protein Tsubulata_021339 [Turnera subulata]